MEKLKLGKCPACENDLNIGRLICGHCLSEYPTNYEFPIYSKLTDGQSKFLEIFLRCKGNLKAVGEEYNISYNTVKNRLDEILIALNFVEEKEKFENEDLDMSNFEKIDENSTLASQIIKKKIYDNNGIVTIPLLEGKYCTIRIANNGKAFISDKINKYKLEYDFKIFDYIVELLKNSKEFKAPKGNAHGKEDKVGYGKCTKDTVVGTIAIEYFKKNIGESTYDPVFVMAAVLDWAQIAHNKRGFIELTHHYKSLIF